MEEMATDTDLQQPWRTLTRVDCDDLNFLSQRIDTVSQELRVLSRRFNDLMRKVAYGQTPLK